MSNGRNFLFKVSTPLGFTVGVTREYWAMITTVKHPVMEGCEAEVQAVLERPEEIRRSKGDANVYLFYRSRRNQALGLRRKQIRGPIRLPHYGVRDRRHQRRRENMAEVNVYYDPHGRTLTVWFGCPQSEYVCEETGEEVVLMKDRQVRVIGFERLNYPSAGRGTQPVRMAFQTLAHSA